MRLANLLAGAGAILVIGCGVDEPIPSGSSSASFSVRESVEQLHVTHAEPGVVLEVVDSSGAVVDSGPADELGSKVFRGLSPGTGYSVRSESEVAAPLTVLGIEESRPDQSFYQAQKLTAGSGYIETRDGTKLAVYITLPGPIENGPYPTVVNYSGYDPAKPGEPLGDYEAFCGELPALCDAPADASALISALMGYATVGVNMRGTGCSGGAYDFFEPLQLLDGYDVIETVAAQEWVLGNRVGMTGLSYPGITQMFVAKTHPPSLAAITPLSVIGNTFTTLVPGGILNDGFAINWGQNVLDKAGPYGQGWEQARVDAGDSICEENQLLHGQKVDIIQKALDNPYYSKEVGEPINPETFIGEIDVPVFFASSFQDEQTGPFFFTLMDGFASAPLARYTVYNGVHPDAFAPQTLAEWKNFLDLHVAKRVPSIPSPVRTLAPALFEQIFGKGISLPPGRFDDYESYEQALADYEKEAPIRVIFESGAGGAEPGLPVGRFEQTFSEFPPAETTPWRLFFQADGTLAETAPAGAAEAFSFQHDPSAGQTGILKPGGEIWAPLPAYDWPAPKPGAAVVFESAPLADAVAMVGSASADLWVSSSVNDADLEVNLSEVRADGKEMYVQSGWLRVSQRALAPGATELWPSHTHLEADAEPLVPGSWVEARVGIPAFAHVFRSGSRIRVSIDTPGGSRAEWRFALNEYGGPAEHSIGVNASQASSVVFSVVPGVTAPAEAPPCPSLRGQPCRDWAAFTNTPAANN